MSKYIYILFLLCSSSFIFSNECLSTASINEQYFNEEVIGLYLSAIDFDSGESNFLLFDYSIDGFYSNSYNCTTSNDFFIGGFKIDFDISMFINGYHPYPELVADGHINIYDIPAGLTSLSFRNTDLTIDSDNIQGASFELKDEQIYIQSQDDEITELFLSSGRVPNGTYYFNFILNECDEYDSSSGYFGECQQIDVLTKQIEVYVPSYIDLIYTGSNSISDSLSSQITNTFPTFQWN